MRYCRRGIREGNPSTPSKPMVRKRLWSPEEDNKLTSYIMENGLLGCWNFVAKQAGIQRSGKSCRLRWINYLRPDLKRGAFSYEEELLIIHLQSALGNRWSLIAAELPGRTDNELKNYWNTCIKKKIMLKHQLSSSTNTNTESNIPSQCNTKSVPAQAHDTFTSSDSAQLYLDFLPEGSQLPYNNFNVVTTTGENRFYVPNLLELEYGQVQTQSDHEFLIDPDPTNIQHISYSPLWINDSYIHTHKSFTSHPAFVAPSLPAYKESCRTIVPPAEAPHSAYGCLGSREFTIPALLGNEWWKEKTENDKNQMMIDYSNAWSAGHSYSNAAECTHVVDPGAYTACDEGISIMEDSDSLYDKTLIGFDKPSI